MIEYRCMSAAELALWTKGAQNVRSIAKRPCADCTLAFHRAEVAAGRCDSRPTPKGGRLPDDGRGRLW